MNQVGKNVISQGPSQPPGPDRAPAAAPEARGRDRFLCRLGLGGIIGLSLLMSFHTLSDTDLFWHLKTGQIIFSTHHVPHSDLYSFTKTGREWIDAQWLFQLMLYALCRVSGYAGMILFGALITALTWTLLMLPAFKAGKYFSLPGLGLVCLLAASFRFNLRPELLSFFYLAAELFLLERFRRGKKFTLGFLPMVLALWVNSEGLWPIYFVILGAFLLEETVWVWGGRVRKYLKDASGPEHRSSLKKLFVCLLGSLPVPLLNPYGYRGMLFPAMLWREVSSSRSFIHGVILEFQSPFSSSFPWFYHLLYLALLSLSGLIVIYLACRRRIYLAAFLLWAVFVYLSLSAVRNAALLAIIVAGLFGGILAEESLGEVSRVPFLRRVGMKLRPWGAGALFLAMAALAGEVISSDFFIQNRSFSRFGFGALETEYPIRGSRFLKNISAELGNPAELKIFSDLDNAGYLIWAGYPEWKLYVDPRLEVYGEEMLERYSAALQSASAFEGEDAKYGFDAVVVGSFLLRKDFILGLYHNPAWVLVYFDGLEVTFLKHRPEFSRALENHRMDLSRGYTRPLPRGLGGFRLARERLYRGYLLLILGHPELAVGELSAGLALEPEEPNLNYYLALAFIRLNRPDRALPYWEKLAAHYPDSAKALLPLAHTCLMLGESDRAIKIFQHLLAENPADLDSCLELARVYETARDPRAETQWRQCREIYQTDPEGFAGNADEISRALKRPGKMR